ncbi:acyltransferase [Janthinobacterium sp. NKUCC08_JDC]|uniref:acyltransferase n=1 Tax=Janthinobacterium sp. NKUCC08_JDC TaxID=2842122 RepID=UPI001C5BF45D|nr:acyltransferase [Janthinobacterium sp. NKUCC08_JDC]MBW3498589.1 acyltransferase [Janthinobacterium sp. NKUCC08_JDC]
MKLNFRYFLDNFRGMAILFVILSHTPSIQEMGGMGKYLNFTLTDATTWFVFISGYLFCYLEVNKFNYMDYLLKKAKYVILPYFFFAFIALSLKLYVSQNVLFDLTPLNYVLWSLLVGWAIVFPLWFIPMIVIFFLMTPVFNVLSKTKSLYVVTFFALLFSAFSSRPINNSNAILAFLHFLGFYLFGVLAASNASVLDNLSKSVKTIIITVSFFVFFISASLYFKQPKFPPDFFSGLGLPNYISIGKLALLVAIFFLFERFMNRENKILGYFAKISFGLFFVHGFVIYAFSKLMARNVFFSEAGKIFLEVGVVFCVSIAVVLIMKKVLKKRSRYVVGC